MNLYCAAYSTTTLTHMSGFSTSLVPILTPQLFPNTLNISLTNEYSD
jgi:hypothetical protein